MFNPICLITIENAATGKYVIFTRVNKVEIVSTWKDFTTTAKITLPRNIHAVSGSGAVPANINDVFVRGSKVTIELGYKHIRLITEFTGYIARVNAEIPFVLECEDEMWQLKQTSFSKAFREVNLIDLVKFIYPGKQQVVDCVLPSFRVSHGSACAVLEDLKKQYGFCSYFLNGILYVGFAFDLIGIPKNIDYHLQLSVPEDGIKLKYKLAEDVQVNIKGFVVRKGGKTANYTAGDKSGRTYQKNLPENTSDNTMKRVINDLLKKFKISGYTGSFEAFGTPFVQHGNIAHIIDNKYPEREGYYHIDGTHITYGVDGFRREIELGRAAYINIPGLLEV